MDGEEEISDVLLEGEIDEVIDLGMEIDDNSEDSEDLEDSEDSMDLMNSIASVTSLGTMQQEFMENAMCVFKGHARCKEQLLIYEIKFTTMH